MYFWYLCAIDGGVLNQNPSYQIYLSQQHSDLQEVGKQEPTQRRGTTSYLKFNFSLSTPK
jgi:hypothetical protein